MDLETAKLIHTLIEAKKLIAKASVKIHTCPDYPEDKNLDLAVDDLVTANNAIDTYIKRVWE